MTVACIDLSGSVRGALRNRQILRAVEHRDQGDPVVLFSSHAETWDGRIGSALAFENGGTNFPAVVEHVANNFPVDAIVVYTDEEIAPGVPTGWQIVTVKGGNDWGAVPGTRQEGVMEDEECRSCKRRFPYGTLNTDMHCRECAEWIARVLGR